MSRNRICVAIDRSAKGSATINVTSYRCPTTGRHIVVNNSLAPYSPYSGGSLKQISPQIVGLPIKEIRTDKDLRCVGDCPTCEGSLYMFAREAKTLVGQRIHCVVCDTKFRVRAEDDTPSTMDSDKDAKKNAKKPNGENDENEDTELVHAAADDDNNDNNDNDDEGENAAGEGEDISGNNNDDEDESGGESGGEPGGEEDAEENAPAAELTAPGNATPKPIAPPTGQEKPVNPVPAPGSETTDVSGEGAGENTDEAGGEEGEGGGEEDEDKNENADEDEDSELVSANTKKLVINCFTRAGGLAGKNVQFIPVSSRLGLIMADDAPVITLDADKAGDNKKLFADPDTLTKAVKAIIDQEENPTPKSFASLGGRAITFTVPVADAIKQRIDAGIAAVVASLDKRKNKLTKEMQACMSTAALIINKNIDRDIANPLRDSLVASLRKFNINSADTMVDEAFIEAAEPYIAAVLAKANELYTQPLSTRNEIARFVERTPFATTANSGGDSHATKFGRDSVTINTAGFKLEEPEPVVREVQASAVNPQVDSYRKLLRR